MRRSRDGRNPYGSRGGYVVSDRAMNNDYARGRNRDYGNDYARGGRSGGNRDYANYAEYDSQRDYQNYEEYDYARNRRDYEQGGQYGRDSGYGYGVGMFDYDTEDYAMRGRDGHYRLSKKDIKKWEKGLESADGTRGKKWEVDQVRQIAQQQGIRFEEYSPELLTAIANMLYSDYCKVLGADPNIYVKLSKAWLEDDDFDGEPDEKAMLYYKCIVEKEDD